MGWGSIPYLGGNPAAQPGKGNNIGWVGPAPGAAPPADGVQATGQAWDPKSAPASPGWTDAPTASWGSRPGENGILASRPGAPGAAEEGTLGGPGAREQAWDQFGAQFFSPGPSREFHNENKGAFTQPSASEQHWAGVSGQNAPVVENRADQAYDQYQREMPGFIDAPDLGTYYDYAQKRGLERLGNEQSSRGVYGSSVGSAQAGDFIGGLEAQRANREADYDLARNADRRATLTGAGQLARSGDLTDIAQAGADLSWLMGKGGAAAAADGARLQGLGLGVQSASAAGGERLRGLEGGMAAAGGAQLAEEGRERGQLNDLMRMYEMLTGMAGGTYANMLGTDMELMDGTLSAGTAGATNAFGMDERDDPTAQLAGWLEVMSGLGWKPFSGAGGGGAAMPAPGSLGNGPYPVLPY